MAAKTVQKAKTVLITGCSSGIGHATAARLAERGHRVVATAPAEDLLADCPASAALRLVVDVTSDACIEAAIARVERELGPVTCLVNNAGGCQPGPIEQLTDDQLRWQFELNVFGMVRMVRRVAPGMRAEGGGRIVNLSSVLGLVSLPMLGAYAASKYAVEGLSDALRMEVAGDGIDVVLIEPGWINTGFAATSLARVNRALYNDGQPYASALRVAEKRQRFLRFGEGTAESVARTIARAVEARRPRPRYRVTALGALLPVVKSLTSTRAFDRLGRRLIS